jgi:hypothetical protein
MCILLTYRLKLNQSPAQALDEVECGWRNTLLRDSEEL